jgi:NADPH:quinone reductase-like Zn-dependent oxidoreductase
MHAVVAERYGKPEELRPGEVPEPKVGPDSVLVRVRAAGCNPVDFKILAGNLDALIPTFFPLVPGWDLAGTVEQVGPAVTSFQAGDEVFGYARQDFIHLGTFAELASVPVRALARKPARLSWAEAGSLPLAGLTAYQALTEALAVRPGQTVLVLAAGGGVGSFAVQIARSLGAKVMGTASSRHHDWVASLGATPLDYTAGEVASQVKERCPDGVDAVLDLVGGEALRQAPGLLSPGGRLASVLDPPTVKELGGRYLFVRPDPSQLVELASMAEKGEVRVGLQEVFPLERAGEALARLAEGHTQGKIALEVG